MFVPFDELFEEPLALLLDIPVFKCIRNTKSQKLCEYSVFTLITVNVPISGRSSLHVSMCVIELALLFFEYGSNLHGCIGSLKRVGPVVALIYEVGLFEVLQ